MPSDVEGQETAETAAPPRQQPMPRALKVSALRLLAEIVAKMDAAQAEQQPAETEAA